ncbi:MAG TPA: hypothetical protein VID03_07085 [Acidimicrobiia bacterium]|jgi:hypothetical protein
MEAVLIVEGLVIILLLILVAGLLRSHGEILRRLHALGAGEDIAIPTGPSRRRPPATAGFGQAPLTELSGVTPAGDTVNVSLIHGRGTTLISFLSSGCSSCRTFWDAFSGDFELPGVDARPVIVTKGPAAESPEGVASLAPPGITTLMSTEAWDAFRVPMTPYFLLADGAGNVLGEGSASTWRHLQGLVRQSLSDSRRSAGQADENADPNGRAHFADDDLRRAGIEPGDPSLYRNPIDS